MGMSISIKRKPFGKKVRQEVYNKTNGRCGYCGEELNDKFCIDHIVPISKSSGTNEERNLMAACGSCNNYKHTFSLEQFRVEISKQIERLERYSVNYRIAKRFGLVHECPGKEIKFYFERMAEECQE